MKMELLPNTQNHMEASTVDDNRISSKYRTAISRKYCNTKGCFVVPRSFYVDERNNTQYCSYVKWTWVSVLSPKAECIIYSLYCLFVRYRVNGAYQFELVLVVANAMFCDFIVSFIRDCLNFQIKRCHWHIRWMKCIYIKWQYQDVTWGIHRDRTLMLNDIFYHDMQISWPDPGSPAIWFLTRSVPKPRIVLAPTARCATCTLPVLTPVTCNTKMCRFKINFSLWNFYIGYFHRFHRIIFFVFLQYQLSNDMPLQVRRLARLNGWKTFVAVHVAHAS